MSYNELILYRTKITGTLSSVYPVATVLIADYNALTYLYGGSDLTEIYANDMFILDTIDLSWKKASLINAPSPRASCGAVFLSNKNIIYIGM